MSFKTKVLAVMAMILLLAGAAGAAVIWTVSGQRPALDDLNSKARHLAETVTPLVHAVDQVLVDIPQVQQWLSDAALTGDVEGYSMAEQHFESARRQTDTALDLARSGNMSAVADALENVQASLTPWYDAGRAVAEAYANRRRISDTELLLTFEKEAAAMNDALNIAAMHAAALQNEALAAVTEDAHAAEAAAGQLSTLVLVLTVVGGAAALGGGVILARLINGVVSGLEHDVGVVSAKGSEPLRLAAGRKDEFGRHWRAAGRVSQRPRPCRRARARAGRTGRPRGQRPPRHAGSTGRRPS